MSKYPCCTFNDHCSYDVESDVKLVLQDAEKKVEVADTLLQKLNSIPLPIQKKLKLSR